MNKIFICQLCNREFNRKFNLNQHLKRKNPCKVNIKSNEKLYQNIPPPYQNIPNHTKIYQNKQTLTFNPYLRLILDIFANIVIEVTKRNLL